MMLLPVFVDVINLYLFCNVILQYLPGVTLACAPQDKKIIFNL
jgi:hypothetical protein